MNRQLEAAVDNAVRCIWGAALVLAGLVVAFILIVGACLYVTVTRS